MQATTRTPDGNGSSSFPSDRNNVVQKRKRTRSGCLNCRGKRRKCDEARPVCVRCKRRNEKCDWGLRVAFRPGNAQTTAGDHPSMRSRSSGTESRRFFFADVTPEVVRDNHRSSPGRTLELLSTRETLKDRDLETSQFMTPEQSQISNPDGPDVPSTNIGISSEDTQRESHGCCYLDDGSGPGPPGSQSQSTVTPSATEEECLQNLQADTDQLDRTEQRDTGFLSPQRGLPRRADLSTGDGATNDVDICLSQPFSTQLDSLLPTPEGSYDDGIFLPGSTYLELHSTLRNSLIHEVMSTEPTRQASPDATKWLEAAVHSGTVPVGSDLPDDDNLPTNLNKKEEYELWKNWLDEIAPWLDKFDSQRHFQNSLPILAQSYDHLRYAMLALSARQLERRDRMPIERSLALYQQAIHLLLPQLHTRSTAAIASCVVLCVLEMLSCSPKAWKRHLDGCASLMEAVGINGFVGGTEQALFWCFARMDVCGGLITSVKTLIPVNHWASQNDLDADIRRFKSDTPFEAYANQTVYLCAQVLDLLASYPTITRTTSFGGSTADDGVFAEKWLKLWRYIDGWPVDRPAEMEPIITMPSSQDNPFPTVLYSNPAAISGNQLYHTASILMLQHKPSSIRLDQKPRSIFWHARQVCAISLSNDHHGAWTNCIQPLWIAGQWLSHPTEHRAILDLLEKIEKESGWGTKWRAHDLKDLWGDMGE